MSEKNEQEWGVVDIHGNAYITVARRVADFRSEYPDWQIKTKIVESTPDHVVFRASIFDANGRFIANGFAQEVVSQMSKGMASSFLEIAETSAVGRALAFAGFGGHQSEIASADEMARRSPEMSMSRQAAYKVMRELVAKADAEDPWGVLEIWDELSEKQRLWVMGPQGLDRVNVEKVNAALKIAQDERNSEQDPELMESDHPGFEKSEKDERREQARSVK